MARIHIKSILPLYRDRITQNVELRDADRLEPAQRSHNIAGFWSAFQFWAGCNVTPLNVILGILGVFKFELHATEAFTIIVIASVLGSTATGGIARYGPLSGVRTMMMARFTHGWYASRLICTLNALMLLAFLIVDTIACRDIISALSPRHAYISTIVVVALGIAATVVAVVGGPMLDFVGRWSWRPQLISMAVLVGGCLMEAQMSAPSSSPSPARQNGQSVHVRIGYGALVCNAVLIFSMAGSDFSHAFSKSSRQWKVAFGPIAGLAVSHAVFVSAGLVVGVAARSNPTLSEAFSDSPATLIGLSFRRLGPVGTLSAVCFVLGSFGAISAGIYVAAVT